MTTLPPLFPVEKSDDVAREHVRMLTKPIFEKALKEDLSNSMTTIGMPVRVFWRPNNYRREYGVISGLDSAFNSGLLLRPCSHNKLLFIRLGSVTLQVGRDKLVGIWSQPGSVNQKQVWLVERNNMNEVDEVLDLKKKVIASEIDGVVACWADKYGIKIGLGGWLRHEDWVKGDDFIDKLPKELIIHDTVFKKVYGDGLEFFGGKGVEPLASTKAYFRNRVNEDFLIKELSGVRSGFDKALDSFRTEALLPLTDQIKLHLEVQRATLKALEALGGGISGINEKMVLNPVSVRSDVFPMVVSDEELIRRLKRYDKV